MILKKLIETNNSYLITRLLQNRIGFRLTKYGTSQYYSTATTSTSSTSTNTKADYSQFTFNPRYYLDNIYNINNSNNERIRMQHDRGSMVTNRFTKLIQNRINNNNYSNSNINSNNNKTRTNNNNNNNLYNNTTIIVINNNQLSVKSVSKLFDKSTVQLQSIIGDLHQQQQFKVINPNRYSDFATSKIIEANHLGLNGNNNSGARFFHPNIPNYFIWGKTLRIVLPFAMGGLRSWISRGNKILRFGLIFLIMFGTSALYIFFNREFAPITGRSRFIGLTSDEEKELGNLSYTSTMEIYHDYLLPENNALQNQVRTVAKNLINALVDVPPMSWECYVIHADQVNAFVLPNGKIFVYTGLFDIIKTEDELAAILSHEIGHAIARHSAERMSFLKVGIVFLTLTRGLIGDTITGNLSTMLSTRLLELSYSRLQEMEADIIGLGILKRANYNVSASVKVLERLHQLEPTKSKFMTILSTHPSSDDRIAKVKEWIDNDQLQSSPSNQPQLQLLPPSPQQEQQQQSTIQRLIQKFKSN